MSMQSLMVLGRQPELGLAELESLYGNGAIRKVGNKTAVVDVDPCWMAFDRLGGSVKFCKLLTTLDVIDWYLIEKYLLEVSPGFSSTMPPGKMQLGLSLIGYDTSVKRIHASGLKLKRAIMKTGRPVRLIPNQDLELNSAQVKHNRLTSENGWELVIVRDGRQTLIAQTIKVQDISFYAKRDRGRPKRDPKVGMLPPKLAQIIINLAVGQLPQNKLESICEIPAGQPIPKPLFNQSLLDPFCGTGVILQEALLMGYDVNGSDIDQKMIDYSQQNILNWLKQWYEFETDAKIEQADATNDNWQKFGQIDFVASETYLGRPFTSPPTSQILSQTISDCNLIIKKFLKNIYNQIAPGARLCLAIPAWSLGTAEFRFLPLIDQISDLGYNRVSFEHSRDQDLIYYRKGQIVARQLLVITRK
ncbi:MAG TPA: hypothetical protein VLF79_00535 [Candidatus Saccharimonadales bacterium]|nr:hypothetical protein [Candidatus Saccharimonadales bacterium]